MIKFTTTTLDKIERIAEEAASRARAWLRSEGYYQSVLEDVVEGDDSPVAIVSVDPGRRFLLTDPTIVLPGPAPKR